MGKEGYAPQGTRPTELRYRLADFVNDRMKAIPGVHRALKAMFRDAAPQPVPPAEPVTKPVAVAPAEPPSAPIAAPVIPAPLPQAAEPAAVVNAAEDLPVALAEPAEGLPYPPFEMRELVGPTDVEAFDNPTGKLIFDHLDPKLEPRAYDRVFDFGCGCGRIARQLILQSHPPERYVGVDLHEGMVRWCQRNLTPAAPDFSFIHHNVYNVGFNPKPGLPSMAPFPVPDSQFTLAIAHSVFTHLTEEQAVHYLRECGRILGPEGTLYSSWFLFNKEDQPMMHEHNNALYVSYQDPSAVVIFDKQWVRDSSA